MRKSLFLGAIAIIISGCSSKEQEVERAMRNYDRLIFHMATDSLADCFAEEGQLGGKGMPLLSGRDSIRKFLKSFDASSIHMISNQSKTTSILFKGDTAIHEGRYEQKAEVNGKPGTYTGTFTAKWIQINGRYQLLGMYTTPD